jgi:NADH:ubiquinone oxidoreductase subunit 6 (subunit J)
MAFWETLFFWIFAAGALVSSSLVIFFRNPLYSALSLIADFFFFAGLYVLLSAHFMAVTQVLVYGGAIMVLFVFIIMLLNLQEDQFESFSFRIHHLIAGATAVGLFVMVLQAVTPIADGDKIAEARAEAAEEYAAKVEAAEKKAEGGEESEGEQESEDDADPASVEIDTKSKIPGLYADLNEEALEARYAAKVRAWDDGTSTPAAGKYPTFDPDKKFEVPPVLVRSARARVTRDSAIEVHPEATATFGTTQPLSLLIVNRFVIPFELTALLLLGAIVGAVIIAKRRV